MGALCGMAFAVLQPDLIPAANRWQRQMSMMLIPRVPASSTR